MKRTFNLKSKKQAPRVRELDLYEKKLHDMIRSLESRPFSNSFQNNLKSDIRSMAEEERLFVPADKTKNHYLVDKENYTAMLQKEVHKEYKKADEADIKKSIDDQKKINELACN